MAIVCTCVYARVLDVVYACVCVQCVCMCVCVCVCVCVHVHVHVYVCVCVFGGEEKMKQCLEMRGLCQQSQCTRACIYSTNEPLYTRELYNYHRSWNLRML